MTIHDFLKALGGVAAVSRELGHENMSTVHSWVRRDSIPDWRKPALAELAKSKGVQMPEAFTADPAGERAA